MSDVKGFIPSVVHEFYVNLFENVVMPNFFEFEKVYVRDYCLKIPIYSFNEFNKMYLMDVFALELLGTKSTWPKNDSLRTSKITLKYYSLHKIAMNNWNLTTYYTTLSRDTATLVFDIGSHVQVNLGHLISLILLIL